MRDFPSQAAQVAIILVLASVSAALPPDAMDIELAPLVTRLLADPLTDAQQKRAMMIFHGQWDQISDPTPAEEAVIALLRFDLFSQALRNDGAPPALQAEAALLRGDAQIALDLLKEEGTASDAVLRARGWEQLGRKTEAVQALRPWRESLQVDQISDAAEMVAAAQALVILARLEGRPAQDYQLALQLLGKARTELDRLYWPALIAEARLLIEKDNAAEAVEALVEALQLNPQASEAWYLLGQLAANAFEFDRVARVASKLRELNETHLLADLLEGQSFLTQRDPNSTRTVIQTALSRYPHHRMLLALHSAAEALAYNQQGMEAALDRFDELAPASPLALFTVGKHLSDARQYRPSEIMLRGAIRRQPNWPPPRVELGLMLMQAGEEEKARAELLHAVELDPFNRRAANQLKLVEELLGYEQIRTQYFIIQFRQGVDEVLARDMAQQLDAMAAQITGIFEHQPRRQTKIQIMPDEQWFGVRITGIPEIWTIAACTGDVIAMVPPREGPKQRGPYDWSRAIRHEYVHTVTLDQTSNRVQHWFTEACAVSQEPGGRDYTTCQLLSRALNSDTLFSLEQINWAFVRPKTPEERPLAYAQAHWMLEYITGTFGHRAVVDMLSGYRDGADNEQVIRAVTGLAPQQFMDQFKNWASRQVSEWGLGPQSRDKRIAAALADQGRINGGLLADLIQEYPDHADLLLIVARRAVDQPDVETARRAVLRYASVRPVDPWSDRMLVQLAIRDGRTTEAIGSLQQLDRQGGDAGTWAYQLGKIHRATGRHDLADDAMIRALHREPYNASYRELAATIALQRGDRDQALHHLLAMALIEPDRAIHQVRLAALYSQMGRQADANLAANKALAIDPAVPVSSFMGK